MDIFTSSRNISKLLDHIIHMLEEHDPQSDGFVPYIAGLKSICFGSIAERNCFTFLSQDEKLASIIEITDFDKLFTMNHNECLDTADSLVNLLYWTPEICKGLMTLISSILKINEKNEEKTKMIMTKLFQHKDFSQLSVELIEKIINYDSTDLELYLINIYAEQRQNPNMLPWNAEDKKHWLYWCSFSANLFREFLCILNELLIRVRNKRVIDITRNFVENVIKICNENNIDYVSLYPLRLQHLVTFMLIDFEPLADLSVSRLLSVTFKSEYNKLKEESPAAALVILTHFAKCETFLG